MSNPMYMEELNMLECQDPECREKHPHVVMLGSTCHPGVLIMSAYLKQEGIVETRCLFCKQVVHRIKVATKSLPN